MRHLVDGRKFGMNTSHRNAMFRNMAVNLIQKEQIETTVAKAKEIRRVVDRLITLGKKGTLHARRLAFARTRDQETVQKLFSALSERYAKRAGGYTRVLRRDGTRLGDGAEMAIVELVDRPVVERKQKAKKKADKAHDHDHDHDHEGHDHGHHHPEKKTRGAGAGKISAASTKGKAAKTTTVRKTSTSSGGGGRSGGSS